MFEVPSFKAAVNHNTGHIVGPKSFEKDVKHDLEFGSGVNDPRTGKPVMQGQYTHDFEQASSTDNAAGLRPLAQPGAMFNANTLNGGNNSSLSTL